MVLGMHINTESHRLFDAFNLLKILLIADKMLEKKQYLAALRFSVFQNFY